MGKTQKTSRPDTLPALVPVYSATLLLSAALLFAVQPMFGKMALPLLGGTPAVWNTLMVFFQAALLGGYAYAHITSRLLTIRQQAILHITLLVLCLFVLPIAIPSGWEPPKTENPSLWVLALASAAVGGPFFVLAGSAPMFQRWFSKTDHKDADNPYFLYAASNLGSLTTLLLYPLLFEPAMGLHEQSLFWRNGFVLLIIMATLSAWLVWPRGQHRADEMKHTAAWKKTLPGWERRIMWVALAFVPSSLMLGVTLYITTDVASVPLLWVIPLALYLLTFVIVFARKPWISHKRALDAHAIAVFLFLFFVLSRTYFVELFFTVHFIVFFLSALMCHWELSASKPRAEHLTEFYLWMSVGGVMGGIFNALIAPVLFNDTIEYFAVLALACGLRGASEKIEKGHIPAQIKTSLRQFVHQTRSLQPLALTGIAGIFLAIAGTGLYVNGIDYKLCFILIFTGAAFNLARPGVFMLIVAIALSGHYLMAPTKFKNGQHLHQSRNFFGVLSVGDLPDQNLRFFFHGTTLHGMQSLTEGEEHIPLGYYHTKSPLGDIFAEITRKGGTEIADLGLGAGVIACYGKPYQHITFFEIDPAVADVAKNPDYFTFLSSCGTPYSLEIGDGRLLMEGQPDGKFDLVFVDAFTSDNIPVHLITKEAIELYFEKTKPGGLVALHISNRFLDLTKPLSAIAQDLGLSGYRKFTKGSTEKKSYRLLPTHIVVLARKEEDLGQLTRQEGWKPLEPTNASLWTDDYSNILSVIWTKKGLDRLSGEDRTSP